MAEAKSKRVLLKDMQGNYLIPYTDKQDPLSAVQLASVDSGATASKVAQIGTNAEDIAVLKQKVQDIELQKFPNAVILGTPTIQTSNVSNFSTSNYMQLPFIVDTRNKTFEFNFCFTTNTNVTTQQFILDSQYGIAYAIQNARGVIYLSSNGTSWDIGIDVGEAVISPDSTYYIKITWDGEKYTVNTSTDGSTPIDNMVRPCTDGLFPKTLFLGGVSNAAVGHTAYPFLGSIDMKYCSMKVAGICIWQGMDTVGLASRADVSLSNLNSIGEAKFNERANLSLSNLSSDGKAKFNQKANISLANLDAAGEARFSNKQNLLTTLPGYDSSANQVLKNVNGSLQWVTEVDTIFVVDD